MTKPSKPAHNDGYDNEDYDYILYVNDWLGTDDGHKCVCVSYDPDGVLIFLLGTSFWIYSVKERSVKWSNVKI